MRVYLSGPITGHSSAEIADWRGWIKLHCPQFEWVDPAIATYDSSVAYQRKESPSEAVKRLLHGRLVVDRNKLLIRSCDLVFANLLGVQTKVSIGSVGELFWASAFGKPIIVVREAKGNVHDHAMINAIASKVCFSLEDGLSYLREFSGGNLKTA